MCAPLPAIVIQDGSCLTYTLDPAGHVASLADTSGSTLVTYQYDATGRLISAIDSASFGTLGYSYDQELIRTNKGPGSN